MSFLSKVKLLAALNKMVISTSHDEFFDLLVSAKMPLNILHDLKDKLEITDNKIKIYRAIVTEKINVNALGIYWSYDKEAAWPYDGREGVADSFYIVTALTPFSSVDIQKTVDAAKMSEQEITLQQGKKIFLDEIRYFGGWSRIKNRGYAFDKPQEIETFKKWVQA